MGNRVTISGALAFTAYAAAVGIAVAYWLPGLWIVLFACVFMHATPHPAPCHLICSASLVLMVLVQAGRIEWMSGFIPALGVVIGIVYSTKMCAESAKPHPVPTLGAVCPLERERREMERILRSECGGDDD